MFYLQEFCHILTELTKQSDLGNGNILPQKEKLFVLFGFNIPPPQQLSYFSHSHSFLCVKGTGGWALTV